MITVHIDDLEPVEPDNERDFLFDFEEFPEAFDAVHTYAVARQVLNMYQRSLTRVDPSKEITWSWAADPERSSSLCLRPRHRKGSQRAFYRHRSPGAEITFGYFRSNYKGKGVKWVYLCQSFDLIAHEMGHAILDGLVPGYISGRDDLGLDDTQKEELHKLAESFADLAAIFCVLGQTDLVESIIVESKCDLKKGTFLPAIAEEFGLAVNQTRGIRSALALFQAGCLVPSADFYQHSLVLTAAVYDLIARSFERDLRQGKWDPAETLYRAGQDLMDTVLGAFLDVPVEEASFETVAYAMIKRAKERDKFLQAREGWEERRFTSQVGRNKSPRPNATPQDGLEESEKRNPTDWGKEMHEIFKKRGIDPKPLAKPDQPPAQREDEVPKALRR